MTQISAWRVVCRQHTTHLPAYLRPKLNKSSFIFPGITLRFGNNEGLGENRLASFFRHCFASRLPSDGCFKANSEWRNSDGIRGESLIFSVDKSLNYPFKDVWDDSAVWLRINRNTHKQQVKKNNMSQNQRHEHTNINLMECRPQTWGTTCENFGLINNPEAHKSFTHIARSRLWWKLFHSYQIWFEFDPWEHHQIRWLVSSVCSFFRGEIAP